MAARGGFGRGRGGFGGGAGGGGGSGMGTGRGRGEVIVAQAPVTFPERSVVQTPFLLTQELSDLADCSHRLGRTTRRSVFFVEKPKSGQDLERYSDRYLYETDKPPIRTLIHGQAWNAFPLELKPPEKRKGSLSNGVGPAAKRGRNNPGKPRVELSDMLGRLEKLDELNPPDKEDDEVVKKRGGDSDDDDEDNEAKSPSAALEEDDEAEDMDDYVQDYAGDDFDALGSESGGDDY